MQNSNQPITDPISRRLIRALEIEYRRFLNGKKEKNLEIVADARQRCISLLKLRREASTIDLHYHQEMPTQDKNNGYLLKIFISYPFSDNTEKDTIYRAFEIACKNKGHTPARGGGIDDRLQWQANFTPLINQRISDCDGFVLYMGPQAITTSTPTIPALKDILELLMEKRQSGPIRQLTPGDLATDLHDALLNHKPQPIGFKMRPWLLWECGVAFHRGLPIDYLGHQSIIQEMLRSVFQGFHVTAVDDHDIVELCNTENWGLVKVFEKALDRVEAEWLTQLSKRLAAEGGQS